MASIDAEIKSEEAFDAIRSDYAARKARVDETAAQHSLAIRTLTAKAQASMDSAHAARGKLEVQVKQLGASSAQENPALVRSATKMMGAVYKYLEGLTGTKKKGQKKAALKTPKMNEKVKSKGKKVAFMTD